MHVVVLHVVDVDVVVNLGVVSVVVVVVTVIVEDDDGDEEYKERVVPPLPQIYDGESIVFLGAFLLTTCIKVIAPESNSDKE